MRRQPSGVTSGVVTGMENGARPRSCFRPPPLRPVTLRDRLESRMAMPKAPGRNPFAQQKSLDIGLFDEAARNRFFFL